MNARIDALDLIVSSLRNLTDSAFSRTMEHLLADRRLAWEIVLEIADAQRVTPTLWVALRDSGVAARLPPAIRERLWKVHLLNAMRNKRLMDQALCAIRVLNSIGVVPALLKGAASLFDDTYDDPGARMMVDLDLLVPEDHAQASWEALQLANFAPLTIDFDYSFHHHLRPLHRLGDPGTLEVHRSPLPRAHSHLLSAARIWEEGRFVVESNANFAVPSATFRVLHNILHTAIVDRSFARGELSIKSIHELALIVKKSGREVDWEHVFEVIRKNGQLAVLDAWLYRMFRWFGVEAVERNTLTFHSKIHFERVKFQARWRRSSEVVDRLMWFSTDSICDRYGCEPGFLPVLGGRIHLALGMLRNTILRAAEPVVGNSTLPKNPR